MQKADEQLVQQAQMVLDFNWNGEYTQPGPHLYPHQWSWDSALIAIGYAHYNQDRAMQELSHLFESQWKNGLLPQIVFNPRFGEYFPGLDFWHAERSPNAPRDRKTSGVVQPPVHATAMLYVYRHAEDEATAKEFLEYNFVKLFADRDYDEARIREDCPFLVQDVLFNALLCKADGDLAEIARALSEDTSPFEERAEKTAHAMNEKLWDEQHSTYLDFDLVSNRLLEVYVAPNFVPLYAGKLPTKIGRAHV